MRTCSFMTNNSIEKLAVVQFLYSIFYENKNCVREKPLPRYIRPKATIAPSILLGFKTLRFISSVSKHWWLQGILYYYFPNIHFKYKYTFLNNSFVCHIPFPFFENTQLGQQQIIYQIIPCYHISLILLYLPQSILKVWKSELNNVRWAQEDDVPSDKPAPQLNNLKRYFLYLSLCKLEDTLLSMNLHASWNQAEQY